MDLYPKSLREVADADLAELVAEREFLERCSALERELTVRWLASRDLIEWLHAQTRGAVCAPDPGPASWVARIPQLRPGAAAARGASAAAPRHAGASRTAPTAGAAQPSGRRSTTKSKSR